MFTYYNNDKIWNICYNEPLKKWITRYSWTPLISENIDHAMFSFDLMRTNIFGIINTNLGRGKKEGLVTVADPYNGVIYDENIIKLNIPQPYTGYTINKYVINGYYYNNNKFEFWSWGIGEQYRALGEPKNVTFVGEIEYKFGKPSFNILNIIPMEMINIC